jgi:hypothetical protein
MKIRNLLVISLLLTYTAAYSQKTKTPAVISPPIDIVVHDTAVVRSYNRIPVFYHCAPLHQYKVLAMMKRTSLVNYSSQAFEKYTKAAMRKLKSRDIAIVIDDLNFGTDSFYVVRFAPEDGRADTAVFATPIFLSARPTKPYKVIRVLNDNFNSGSLNGNLQRYLIEAATLHVPYDGIMVRDVNYTFGKDAIFVFRWR